MTILQQPNSFRTGPDERGHFGIYGGRFVAETLMPLILELEKAYNEAKADPAFQKQMAGYLKNYIGRPSPLYFAERLTEHFKGAKIYFKREDLNHTGAHKVNNVLGQIMLAKRMGKPRVIAETGAGMHGVATATMCAKFGLQCVVFMGAVAALVACSGEGKRASRRLVESTVRVTTPSGITDRAMVGSTMCDRWAASRRQPAEFSGPMPIGGSPLAALVAMSPCLGSRVGSTTTREKSRSSGRSISLSFLSTISWK